MVWRGWLAALLAGMLSGCGAPRSPGEQAYFEALRLEKAGGDAATVEQLLNRAVALEPGNAEFLRARGTFHFDRGAYQAALEDLSVAAGIRNGGQAYCLYLKGLTEGRLGRYQEALNDFVSAQQLQPDNGQFYAGSSLAHLALKHPEEALRDISKAEGFGHPAAHWNYIHGVALACLRRKEESVAQFNRTPVYAEAGADGKTRDHYFDGEREFARVQACSSEELLTLWHYGGRWLPAAALESYRRR